MTITRTYTRVHTYVGFANPFLVCDHCKEKVPYWHDPDRCGCNAEMFNYPCEHKFGTTSVCFSWSPVDGCQCTNKDTHDKD